MQQPEPDPVWAPDGDHVLAGVLTGTLQSGTHQIVSIEVALGRNIMEFQNFAEVREQDELRLRELVRRGDGPERVWAAWALGLRLGDRAVPFVRGASEPDPGVRAHLVIVLAGFGRDAAIRALATDDPDPTVRATACDYLIRIAPPSRREEVLQFLGARASTDPSPIPVTRVLRCVPTEWPELDESVLADLLGRGSRELRREVIEHVVRTRAPEKLPRGLLTTRLREEQDPRLLVQLAELLVPEAEADVLAAAERVPEAVPPLLQLLVRRERRVDWHALGDLPEVPDPRVRLSCLKLTREWEEPEALTWLSSVATSGRYRSPDGAFATSDIERARDSAHYDAQLGARERIMTLISRPGFALFAPLADALRELLQRLEDELEWLAATHPDDLEDEGIDREAELQSLADRRRLLVTALARCR